MPMIAEGQGVAARLAAASRLAAAFDQLAGWAAASHARALVVLLAFGLLVMAPGIAALGPMDRDEPRFAQATKQMLESGDLVDIRFQDEARHKKPVGIYWLQAMSVAAGEALGAPDARRAPWLYRLPSLAGALAAVGLAYWAALAFASRRGALVAALLLAACVLPGVEARLAKTDAVLAALSVAALGGLARAYLRRGPGRAAVSLPLALGFWLALGAAVLVKGPVVPLLVALPAAALSLRERSARWLLALRPGLGIVIVAAVALPWIGAIAWRSGGAFFAEAVGKDLLGKVGAAQERHGAPPGAYLAVMWATLWPAAPLIALAAPFAWRERRDDAVAFLLAWAVPSWLLFEALPTKLPHYVLPLLPALILLVVVALERGALRPGPRQGLAAGLLLMLVPAGLLVGLPPAARWLDGAVAPGVWAALPFLAAALALAALAVAPLRRGNAGAAVPLALGAALLTLPAVLGLALPALDAVRLSPRLAHLAAAVPCEGAPRAHGTAGYREPSLVLLTATSLAMEDGAGLARWFAAPGCRVAFVEAREEAAFRAALPAPPEPLARARGFNLNGGRRLDVALYARPR